MKISVTLPNYNHGHYIRDNLDGLLAQTYQNWELHVVDDGSTDDSAQIIAEYAARDARIKPIYFPQNQGVEAALDCGMKAADGELLYCTAADDYICNPHFFEMAVDAFRNTTAAVFSGNMIFHHEQTQYDEVRQVHLQNGFLSPQEAMGAFFNSMLPDNGHCAILRRKYVPDLFKFKDLKTHIDGFLIISAAIQSGFFYHSDVVVKARISGENYGCTVSPKNNVERFALMEKYIKQVPLQFHYDLNIWKQWREKAIQSTIHVMMQNEGFLLNKFSEFSQLIPEYKKQGFGPNFLKILSCFDNPQPVIHADKEHMICMYRQIFNDIAGSLE